VLTLFSVPKPFRNHIGTIQTNALQSWLKLEPRSEVILFGHEEGTAAVATRLGMVHLPEVSCNEFGTPLLNDLFEKAQQIATHQVICFVNADMILMDDFMTAIRSVSRSKKSFLMVGRRWNLDLHQPFDFDRHDWEKNLRLYAREHGSPGSRFYIDYFVFPKGLFKNLPPFAIGRAAFDNWLLWRARSLGASLVDASQVVMAVHQNHDYAHHPEGKAGVYEGTEAKRNKELMGGSHRLFTLEDASHYLTASGLKRNLSRQYFRRRWKFFKKSYRRSWHRLGNRESSEENIP
jgi:hypothetical protein